MPVHWPGLSVRVRWRKSQRSRPWDSIFAPALMQFDGGVAELGRRRDEEVHLAFLGRRFQAFHLVEGFEAMARLGALGADAGADPIEFLAQEALAAAFGLVGDLLADGFGFEVGGVIPGMGKAPAIGELDDARGDDIEEIAVVGDEDDGAGEFAEEFLEPEDGFGVEVVGGFVQQEEVGLGGQRAAEGDAAFFAAGERADEAIRAAARRGRRRWR